MTTTTTPIRAVVADDWIGFRRACSLCGGEIGKCEVVGELAEADSGPVCRECCSHPGDVPECMHAYADALRRDAEELRRAAAALDADANRPLELPTPAELDERQRQFDAELAA